MRQKFDRKNIGKIIMKSLIDIQLDLRTLTETIENLNTDIE